MGDLAFDIARRLKQDTGLIPPGEVFGQRLTFVGPGPMDFGWVQDAEGQILKGVGDPNGVQFAPKGTLYVERDVPALWQNDDGLSSWTAVGTAGLSVLTNSYYEFIDDGTTTGKLQTAGDVENKWDVVSGGTNGSDVSLSSGKVTIDTTGIYSIAATWLVKADTAADLYNYARGRFTLERSNEPGSPNHDFVFLDDVKYPAVNSADNKHIASFTVSITAFMFAGDDVICETRFESSGTAGSNWSIQTASMYVERLA